MKRLIVATLALSLLDATGAFAQDGHHDHAGGGGAPHAGAQGHPGGGAAQGHPGGGGPRGGERGGGQDHAGPPPGGGRSGPFAYVPQGQGDRPHMEGGPAPAAASRGGRRGYGAPGFQPGGNDRPRYSPQYFPRQIHSGQRYHWAGQGWAGQPGYYHRHWGYGDYLPDGWFAASFWIGDYGDYSLPVPPYGYEWVRVGPDALLVDTYSGEVVETDYGIFY